MKQVNILYTDEHDVTVTNSFFKVKKSVYQLNGITDHGFMIIRPERLPAFSLLSLGLALIITSALQYIPQGSTSIGEYLSIGLTINSAAALLGLLLVAAGTIVMAFVRERYAVRITTAEGEKNVIVSRNKEYVSLILNALNHAFLSLVKTSSDDHFGIQSLANK